ncbi:hypothetical protein PWY87_20640 [Kribbella solani]|uniref:hypothetical protein n=1 Tax=Kribbella solani TaxID=236067 RepID=UPI0029B46FFF|nr:hypothetical protein [Kribbella solani]MDX2972424.1 hypothetical protein [Kribbella solani]MDX3004110.1 hypothetical protein [Kribbella solani]
MRTAIHRAREERRDGLANSGSPPGTGPENSSVSDQALTQAAYARLGAGAPSPRLSPDLTQARDAATLPPVTPGQSRPGTSAGERDKPGSQPNRSTGRGHGLS